MAQPKGIPVAPLTGLLDTRSSPDSLPQGALRMRQNMQTVAEGKLRRGCGWTKALSQTPYNNQDFHDQLLLFGGTVREPVTGLFEFQSARGIRSFWLTTQSRIAKLNETTGNWKVIASGLGGGVGTDCSGPRFKASNVGDYVWFTNNHDRPKIHRLEQPPFDGVLIADSPDLEAIGLTKAALTWAWKDVVFFADVEMDGERHGNRLVWGDFKNPPSFDPAKPESIAGFADLDYGERILAGGPTTAGTYLLYTTQGIWELFTDPVQTFAVRHVYDGKKADFTGVLKYQNTLVDLGGDHLYMAQDGLYAFNSYRSAPELVLWLHRATSALYDDLDDTVCAPHIGFFHDGAAFFSVKRTSDIGCPGVTLRIETQFKVADVIDFGFTAAANFRSQPIPTIRDFILDQRICDLSGLTASLAAIDLPPPFENEGLPAPAAEPTADFTPTVFYTKNYQIIGDVVTEDWNQAAADADSLCALLGDTTLDDLCINCESVSVLIAASSQDWCLKQFGGFYRERCANPTATGATGDDGYTSAVGSYLLDGYDSIIRFAPLWQEGHEVTVQRFGLRGIPAAQVEPSNIGLRCGISGQTADPNDDHCPIVWLQLSQKELRCVTERTAAEHTTARTVPAQDISWRFERTGKVVYLELKIVGTGGDCVLSGAVASAKASPARNF